MVVVSISETYDLHTVVNKMTLIGIHTPKKELIAKTYPGLCMNYKYFRIKSVDCVLSTAQQLPLSVNEIGLDEGDIRPQDMMNPILYKAVSNDSWSTLEYRLKGLMTQGEMGGVFTVPPVSGNMADVENDGVTNITDEHGVYYALLSNRDGFRAANPQRGVEMRNLRPLVFNKLYSDAVNTTSGNIMNDGTIGIVEDAEEGLVRADLSQGSFVMRGHATPMPRINTTYITGIDRDEEVQNTHYVRNGMMNGVPANFQAQMPDISPVMLGCIVLPPVSATTGILYYRMVTRAWIEFTDVRPIQEITAFKNMSNLYAPLVYHSDYNTQSKYMDSSTDMVDIKNGEIEKIMEGK